MRRRDLSDLCGRFFSLSYPPASEPREPHRGRPARRRRLLAAAASLFAGFWASAAFATNCPSNPYTLTNGQAADDTGVSLDQATVQHLGANSVWGAFNWGAGVWGAFNWGAGVWGSPVSRAYERPINFHQPIVARQFQAQITGFSSTGVKVGNLYLTAQPTGYSLQRFT